MATLDNQLPPVPLAKWMSRDGVMQCHGRVTFRNLDGTEVFARAMPFRWSISDQPVPLRHFVDRDRLGQGLLRWPGMKRLIRLIESVRILDENWFLTPQTVDVYPGDGGKEFAVVVRFDDQDEYCFGWSNVNYRFGARSPWKLMRGVYLVDVVVHTSARVIEERFRLVDDGTRAGLRLERWYPRPAHPRIAPETTGL